MNDSQDEHLKIGEFARLANTGQRTLRYYEEIELLVPVQRSAGGTRYYRASDLHRVQLIQFLAGMGMQLDQIGELIRCAPERACLETPPSADARAAWIERVTQALRHQEELIQERVQALRAQAREVKRAREQLTNCTPCDLHPNSQNNYCNPCAQTGDSLPTLLHALFR